ncbi:MAG: 5-formyltetrahydrofolate cyclo-ligase [Zetaproteobacteria bacterium CG_4_9_14_3_um_filter_53_7]|nr:MAG: 5-formyltetrahydrofolate cyclo-ligase [Zetaproteobacteria bacterium CG_4_9_14_3_um_filter_53_7]
MDKTQIRAFALQQRKSLTELQRQTYSQAIMSNLLDYLAGQTDQPQNLLIYRSLPSEVATDALLVTQDYRMFAPVTHHHEHMEWHALSSDTRWQTGLFGILEPDGGSLWDEKQGITTLLSPLTAFDRSGNRLGMGKGCFDFWLAQHRVHIKQIIGLAYACQEVAEVPAEGHDVPMDCIITEKEVIQCPRR